MKIVRESVSVEELIKKSRFISIINSCKSEQQARKLLQQLLQQHPDSSHIAYADLIKGLLCRFHNAGEPSGTVRVPKKNLVLLSDQLKNLI